MTAIVWYKDRNWQVYLAADSKMLYDWLLVEPSEKLIQIWGHTWVGISGPINYMHAMQFFVEKQGQKDLETLKDVYDFYREYRVFLSENFDIAAQTNREWEKYVHPYFVFATKNFVTKAFWIFSLTGEQTFEVVWSSFNQIFAMYHFAKDNNYIWSNTERFLYSLLKSNAKIDIGSGELSKIIKV